MWQSPVVTRGHVDLLAARKKQNHTKNNPPVIQPCKPACPIVQLRSMAISGPGSRLVAGESAGEDALNRRELGVRNLSQRHLVKLRPKAVSELGPKVSPVHVRLLALFLELGAAGVRAGEHVAVSLLADDGDVPLCMPVSQCHGRLGFRSRTSMTSSGAPGLGASEYWWRQEYAYRGWP